MFADVSKEELEEYALLLDKSTDEIKKDLQVICKDYYLDYFFNNGADFEKAAQKLQDYLNLNIDAIDEYINFCLLVTINTLLDKLYHVKGYDPIHPGLQIMRYQQRQAKYFIENNAINDSEVLQTIEHNKQSNDLWVLRGVTNLTVNVKPNIDLPGNVRNTALANINYLGYGEDEIYNTAKLFLGLSFVMSSEKEEFKEWFDDYIKEP